MTGTALAQTTGAPALELYRDDGPIAAGIGRAVGARARVPGALLAAAGTVPLLAAIAVTRDEASDGLIGAAVLLVVLLVGASSGRPLTGRFAWALPVLVRLAEFSGLIWIGANAGSSTAPAVFALLSAVIFRRYEAVYRLRHRGEAAPHWIALLGGGWEGRLVLAYGCLVLGLLPAAFYVAGAVLGAVFVAESIRNWGLLQRGTPLGADEEEEEGE